MPELASGTVTATFVGSLVPASNAPTGHVYFVPMLEKSPADMKIVLPRPEKATLSNGALSIGLVATDNEDLIPADWYYWVTPFIPGVYIEPFAIQLSTGQTLDITDSLTILPIPVDTQIDLLGRLSDLENSPSSVGMAWSFEGELMPTVGAHRFYNDTGSSADIESVRATVATSPTGSSVIIDVNIDGVSIFTDQSRRPTVGEGELTDLSSLSDVRMIWPAGSYLTVDIDQVGSITPGENLTVNVVFVG